MNNLWIIYGYGWWYTYPSEKYDFVSWDDNYSQYMERYKMFQTTNQYNTGPMFTTEMGNMRKNAEK